MGPREPMLRSIAFKILSWVQSFFHHYAKVQMGATRGQSVQLAYTACVESWSKRLVWRVSC